jgi:hypothetical protein
MSLVDQISRFVWSLQTDRIGEFHMCHGGKVTLYASCFAAMTLHYLGELSQLSQETRRQWADYILQWQNQTDGYFLGPELVKEEITSTKHNWDVVRMHLAVHVLPALDLLGKQPLYPLTFAHCFLDTEYLQEWLAARDWQNAWLEGNNLLFIGQFLLHLRDVEYQPGAQESIDLYLKWLDERIDPLTGLWGTSDGLSSWAFAVYGAYHQLLVYFYEEHPVPYPEQLVDSTLSVQEFDGGFSASGRGGACEDVDAISILVNLYQRYDCKRPRIRRALRRAFTSILKRLDPEGGFVYRWGAPFIHMSIPRTRIPANVPHLFATWFGTHTLALLAEVLTDEPTLAQQKWQFNRVLSMGWHRPWNRNQRSVSEADRRAESRIAYAWDHLERLRLAAMREFKSGGSGVPRLVEHVARSVLRLITQNLTE